MVAVGIDTYLIIQVTWFQVNALELNSSKYLLKCFTLFTINFFTWKKRKSTILKQEESTLETVVKKGIIPVGKNTKVITELDLPLRISLSALFPLHASTWNTAVIFFLLARLQHLYTNQTITTPSNPVPLPSLHKTNKILHPPPPHPPKRETNTKTPIPATNEREHEKLKKKKTPTDYNLCLHKPPKRKKQKAKTPNDKLFQYFKVLARSKLFLFHL